jgi:hypothetical protein
LRGEEIKEMDKKNKPKEGKKHRDDVKESKTTSVQL